LALLIIHADFGYNDIVDPEKLNGRFKSDRGMFMPEADEGLDINVSAITADLKIALPRATHLWQWSCIIQM
jgi:hypothetical protein